MINIDFLTLRAFLVENIDFIIGARLQKIQQPTRRDFILVLRNNSVSKKLYININPQIYHLAFMSEVNEEKRNIKIPKKPPMFCMLLRKYLEGSKISDALVIDKERILELHFETYDELKEKKLLCLCIELMGKHSNVILYDKSNDLIIGCAHNVGLEKSRYRELHGGLKYVYPPKVSGTALSDELKFQFKNLSPQKIDVYLNTEDFRPAIADNRYTLFCELIPNSVLQPSVNEMIDNYYSNIQFLVNLKTKKSKLLSVASARLKKVRNSVSKINNLLEKRDNTDKYKLFGELLTANLYLKADYIKTIKLYDYISGEDILIELDEKMSMKENAQRYFKLYNKSKMTKEKSLKMLSQLKIEEEYLDNVVYTVNSAINIEELDEISSELALDDDKIEKLTKKSLIPSVEKIIVDGFEIYIGKNNKQNDYIVTKLAKEDDLWFHTKMCAGSHVLLKVNEKEPNENIIFECCKLARKHSSASQPSKVGVIYTKGKYLRKPPASPLGYVTYKNEKEILI